MTSANDRLQAPWIRYSEYNLLSHNKNVPNQRTDFRLREQSLFRNKGIYRES